MDYADQHVVVYVDELIRVHEHADHMMAHHHITCLLELVLSCEQKKMGKYYHYEEGFLDMVDRMMEFATDCGWAGMGDMPELSEVLERKGMYGEDDRYHGVDWHD